MTDSIGAKQYVEYPDPATFAPIGPMHDPGDTCVSIEGQIFSAGAPPSTHALDLRYIPDLEPHYIRNALTFALYENGKVAPMGEGEKAHQSLVDGYLPIVRSTWKHGAVTLEQTAFGEILRGSEARNGNERTLAWVAIKITNTSQHSYPMEFLGFYTADETDLHPAMTYREGAVVTKDGALMSARAPKGFSVDFLPTYPQTAILDQQGLSERRGVFNALVIRGSIPAGKTVQVVFNYVVDPAKGNYYEAITPEKPNVEPQEITRRSYATAFQKARTNWREAAKGITRFDLPDARLQNIYRKAALDGYFLTKKWNGRLAAYDSVIYRCQWDSSSMNWVYALDCMGDFDSAQKMLDTVLGRQGQRKPAGTRTHKGCFSDVTNTIKDGSDASWASGNGWALYAMAEHARLSNDREWLKLHKRQILDGCDWIIRERAFSKEKPGNSCYGLLNGKFVCDLFEGEDVDAAGYFTYTDAIGYVGLHEMAILLDEWGHAEGKALLKEAEAYRLDIEAAIERLTDKSRNPWFVPWALSSPRSEQRYFHDIVGPINLAFACTHGGVYAPDSELIDNVSRWTVYVVHERSLEKTVAGNDAPVLSGGSAFYSQDLALNLLERRRVDDFLTMFYTLLDCGISHDTLTTTEWGINTQPHLHSLSSVIRMLRYMLIQERDGDLYLLQGVPREWFEQGNRIRIVDAPTAYGNVSLDCRSNLRHKELRINLNLPDRLGETPVHLRLRLPGGMQIKSVMIDGKRLTEFKSDEVILRGRTGSLPIVVKVDR